MQHQNRIRIRRLLSPDASSGIQGKRGLAGAVVVARFLIPIYRGFIGRHFGLEEGKGGRIERKSL